MDVIVVAADTTEVSIPRTPGIYSLLIQFPGGKNERAELTLDEVRGYENTDLRRTCVTSRPCGSDKVTTDILNKRLDEISHSAFGSGKWLNVQRHRDESYSEEEERRQQSIQSEGDEDIRERRLKSVRLSHARSIIQQAFDQLDPEPKALGLTESDSNGRKRKRSDVLTRVHDAEKTLQGVTFGDEEANTLVQEATDKVMVNGYTQYLLDAVKKGFEDLKTRDADPQPPTRQFVGLFDYRAGSRDAGGARLAGIFDGQAVNYGRSAKRQKRATSQRKWECTILADMATVLHRHSDRSQVFDDWDKRKRETISLAILQILDRLYAEKGAIAWVVLESLRKRGNLLSFIKKLNPGRMEAFIAKAVAALRLEELDLPDDCLIFHLPAWLAWVRSDMAYSEVCEVLGLEHLKHQDPEVSRTLDNLMSEYERLDVQDPGYDVALDEIDRKVNATVFISIGELKSRQQAQQYATPREVSEASANTSPATSDQMDSGEHSGDLTPRPNLRGQNESLSASEPNAASTSVNTSSALHGHSLSPGQRREQGVTGLCGTTSISHKNKNNHLGSRSPVEEAAVNELASHNTSNTEVPNLSAPGRAGLRSQNSTPASLTSSEDNDAHDTTSPTELPDIDFVGQSEQLPALQVHKRAASLPRTTSPSHNASSGTGDNSAAEDTAMPPYSTLQSCELSSKQANSLGQAATEPNALGESAPRLPSIDDLLPLGVQQPSWHSMTGVSSVEGEPVCRDAALPLRRQHAPVSLHEDPAVPTNSFSLEASRSPNLLSYPLTSSAYDGAENPAAGSGTLAGDTPMFDSDMLQAGHPPFSQHNIPDKFSWLDYLQEHSDHELNDLGFCEIVDD